MIPQSASTSVSIIVVTWNSGHLLEKCLKSALAAPEDQGVEVWVVDNASTDDTVAYVQSLFPQVHLIANPCNMGFAAANNQAARRVRSEYLLLLNPDAELRPDALSSMLQYANAHPDIGVLGPALFNADGSHQRSCWRGYPGLAMALIDALYLWKLPRLPLVQLTEYRPEELTTARDVDHLLGACLLIRREAWRSVGPLDEEYFLFLEETDWCLRAKRAGWRIVYDPDAQVVHYGQHSARQQPARNLPQLYKSYCHFYRKHHHRAGQVGLLALKSIIAVASLLRVGMWRLRGQRSQGEAVVQAQQMASGYRRVLKELSSF